MKKLLLPLLLFYTILCQGQDPLFSQFYAMPLQINPAFAGSSFAPRFGVGYRYQWPGLNRAYTTYAAFYEQSLDRLNSGIGFNLEGDDAGNGILKTTRFSANYAYRVMMNEYTGFKIGIEAGGIQTALNWDKLIFPDQIDPIGGAQNPSFETRPDQLTTTRLDLSAGLLFFSKRAWVGTALKHLNTPDEAFVLTGSNLNRGLPIRFTLHGGFDIPLREGNKAHPGAFISPNILVVSQGPFQQVNAGAYLGIGAFHFGTWFRHTTENADALILMAGIKQGVFKLGVTYDATVSRLANVSGGTYEMTMSFLLDQDENLKKKKRREQTAECPRFFR
jgi:type IX secretion system PorP/SprF family membrane protein